MDPDFFQRVKDVFADAIGLPVSERPALLEEKCAGDLSLLEEVNSLLAEYENPQDVIEANAFNLKETLSSEGKNYDGKIFGNYKILCEIGHGGMGAVFLAERNDGQFDRQVALKIVRQTIVSSDLSSSTPTGTSGPTPAACRQCAS